jgi:hypothetical protein
MTLLPVNNFIVEESRSKFKIDPLVSSVAFYRKHNSFGLLSEEEHILEEDVIKAKQIRDYYNKKYFWNSLKTNKPQPEFRTNAMRLLAITDRWDLTERESGLFVKLPCFYEEDIVYDDFRTTLITNKDSYTFGFHNFTYSKHTLTHIKNTIRWQGRSKKISYWFKDKENKLFSFTTDADNPLNELFEEKIQTTQEYEFRYVIDKITDMWYNNIKIFNFKKEQHA